jgi:hypothetical protein
MPGDPATPSKRGRRRHPARRARKITVVSSVAAFVGLGSVMAFTTNLSTGAASTGNSPTNSTSSSSSSTSGSTSNTPSSSSSTRYQAVPGSGSSASSHTQTRAS